MWTWPWRRFKGWVSSPGRTPEEQAAGEAILIVGIALAVLVQLILLLLNRAMSDSSDAA